MERINNRGHLSAGEMSPSHPSASEILDILYKVGLKPGVNWQRELKELIGDIAARDDIDSSEVLKLPEFQIILNNNKLSGPQKLDKIKRRLFAKRYPTVAKARKIFNEELKKLQISPKIKVRFHPYFEEERLYLEYDPKYAELEEVKVSLKKIEGADLVINALKRVPDCC